MYHFGGHKYHEWRHRGPFRNKIVQKGVFGVDEVENSWYTEAVVHNKGITGGQRYYYHLNLSPLLPVATLGVTKGGHR